MIGPFSYLDLALIAVAFLSALLAMYRGFTREILSILSWAAAGAAVLYFVLKHKAFAEEMSKQMGAPLPVAQIAIGAMIFLIVLVVVHLITARISDTVLDSRVGMVDRFLGFVFGLARGFILIVIPYMFYESFVPDAKAQFPWVRQSMSLPYLQSTGNALRNVLVRYIPSSLTAPSGEPQQQGFINAPDPSNVALAGKCRYHISVTWRSTTPWA